MEIWIAGRRHLLWRFLRRRRRRPQIQPPSHTSQANPSPFATWARFIFFFSSLFLFLQHKSQTVIHLPFSYFLFTFFSLFTSFSSFFNSFFSSSLPPPFFSFLFLSPYFSFSLPPPFFSFLFFSPYFSFFLYFLFLSFSISFLYLRFPLPPFFLFIFQLWLARQVLSLWRRRRRWSCYSQTEATLHTQPTTHQPPFIIVASFFPSPPLPPPVLFVPFLISFLHFHFFLFLLFSFFPFHFAVT